MRRKTEQETNGQEQEQNPCLWNSIIPLPLRSEGQATILDANQHWSIFFGWRKKDKKTSKGVGRAWTKAFKKLKRRHWDEYNVLVKSLRTHTYISWKHTCNSCLARR